MAGFPFKFINGNGVAGVRTPIEREAAWPKRTDNNNYLRLPLELKAFEGLRAVLAQGLAERGFTAALTGQSATTAKGGFGFRNVVAIDNFTGTNGDQLTFHTPDSSPYGYWTLTYDPFAAGDPTIQTNRLRGNSTGSMVVAQMDGTQGLLYDDPWWWEAVLYRRNTTGSADDVNGLAGWCAASGGYSSGADAWQFGWNELNDYWELRRLYGGSAQSIATSTTNAFTGTSESRTIRMRITGSAGSCDIVCEVDGTQVFTHNETLFYINDGQWGVTFSGDSSVDIDSFWGYDDALRLGGLVATTAAGELRKTILDGYVATTAQGVLAGSTGSTTEQELTGLAATTAYGTITPSLGEIIGALTGYAATTAYGTTVAFFGPATEFDLSLRVSWTYNTNNQNPGNIGTQFVPWAGVLYGNGNYASEYVLARFPRGGTKRVDQKTEQTYPWTANPAWGTSDNAGMAIDDTSNPNLIGAEFPRGFASSNPGWRYNTVLHKGGWTSISTGGAIWSAVERIYTKMGSIVVFLAPHYGEVANPNYYNGPELFTGHAQDQPSEDPHRQGYVNVAPMGLYPLSENEVLGFYPQIIDGQITGKFADLVGFRATIASEPSYSLSPSYTGSDGAALTGLVATTTTEKLGVDGSAEVELSLVSDLNATAGKLFARDAHVVPAFRRLKGGVWSDETLASTFSGATRVWTRSHHMTVVPTGYGNLVYVVYYSENVLGHAPQMGVVVMDALSGVITSNTLYNVAATSFNYFSDGGLDDDGFLQVSDKLWRPWGVHKQVATSYKLGSGTHVTQFLLCGQVVHISWTSGTRTTPTVTVKDGVYISNASEAIFPAFESLELRGDKVYHLVPRGNKDGATSYDHPSVTTMYVNDATGTGSTWTTPTITNAETGTSGSARTYSAFYGGHGSGYKTWWYVSWWASGFNITEDGHDTAYLDAWYQQPKGHTVSATAVLGSVTTNVTPNAALTGLRAETRTDVIGLFPLVDGDKVARLTDKGKRLITKTPSGKDFLPYDEFFVDNFTGSGTLLAHTADTGQTWEDWGQEHFVLDGYGAVYCSATNWGNYVAAFPTMTPPGNDYCVNAKFASVRAVTVAITGVINEGVGARVKNGQGYWFGYNYYENTWYLSKGRPDQIAVSLPEYVWPGTLGEANVAEFSIEVTGTSPTRVRCFINDVQVIDYTDSDAPQYVDGAPGICSTLGNNNRHYIDYINAGVHDAQALILVGQRATTARGYIDFGILGQAATTAQGVLTPDTTSYVALTGLAATTAKGDFYWFPDGLAATTAYGTITPSVGGIEVSIGLVHGHIDTFIGVITIPIVEAPGLAAITAQGVLGLAIDQAPEQTGLVATTVLGTIVPEVGTLVTGQVATGDLEPPVPEIAAPWWSWGLFSQARGGTLSRSAEDLAALVGNAAVMQQGTLTPEVAEDSSVSGQNATSSAGLLTPVVIVTMTGEQTVSEQGVVTASLVYQLTGLAATTQEDFGSIFLEIFLEGRSATTTQGVLGYQYGGAVTASGFQMQLLLGSVSDVFKKPSADLLLWALHHTEELFAQEAPDEENPVVAPNE
jgi:hypothetical protein